MLIVPLFLVFTIRFFFTSHSTGVAASELYFRLLQTDGQLSKQNMYSPKGSRRPSPSDHLPIEDLLENENKIYDPRPSDINVKRLRAQLGRNFDREYMSIRDPRNRSDKNELIPLTKGRPKGRRPNFLRLLRSARLQDGRKIRLNVGKKDRRKIQKYIWSLTFCPVKHSWKYLGIRFWPQWIKEGQCTNERSCSIPEGMTCQPILSSNKTLLRWHCQDWKDRNTCQWIPVLYPIITECSCSC